jgi:hypothetical protein
MDELMYGYIDRNDGSMVGYMDRWIDGCLMDGWVWGRMDGWLEYKQQYLPGLDQTKEFVIYVNKYSNK